MFRISSTTKPISLILLSIISATSLDPSPRAQEENTSARRNALPTSISIPDGNKDQDGLVGPVRLVRSERAELSMKSGKLTEGPRALLSTTLYDLQGNSVDNTYYLVTERNRSLGKEEYKYDDKGNVIEMTLRNNEGAILSREAYAYEFDVVGNWNKMVTSLVIYERGKLSYEPVDVTYRTLSYYSSEAVLSESRMLKPQAILFSDGVATDEVMMIPSATYPDEAKRAGVTGIVAVIVEIDVEGKVVSARAVRGHPTLRAASVEAAMKARFSPTLRTNQTAKRSGVISFTFSLIQ